MAFRPLALAWLLVCGAACAQVPQRNINFDLLAAARSGNVAVVASLLDQGANPNPRNRLGDTPLISRSSLLAVAACTARGRFPSTKAVIRRMYCCAVSRIAFVSCFNALSIAP